KAMRRGKNGVAVRRDPPRLILAQQFGRRLPTRLTLIIDVCNLLTVSVPHDETVRGYFGRPGCGKAAARHCESMISRLTLVGDALDHWLSPEFPKRPSCRKISSRYADHALRRSKQLRA